MDFALSGTHRLLQQTVREFAQKELAPLAEKVDREHYFPVESVKKLGEMGFMGVFVPEKLGGAGMDFLSYVIVMEEVAAACAATSVIVSVNNSLVCAGLLQFGTESQKRDLLVPLASGKQLGCYCLSEPDTGSDAAAQRTRATRNGGGWIIEGAKNFISSALHADWAIVFAMAEPDRGSKGITAFLVDTKSPGFEVGKPEMKLGICGSATSQITLNGVRVPEANVLGEVNGGFKIAMTLLESGRIGIAAQALGIGRAAYEAAVKYSKERVAFGKPISANQGIQWYLCDMAVRLENSRNLICKATWLKETGQPFGKEAAMAKLYASESANWIANKALQIHGGNGYLKEYPVERYFRDARVTEIYEGTTEIQRLVIARHILKD